MNPDRQEPPMKMSGLIFATLFAMATLFSSPAFPELFLLGMDDDDADADADAEGAEGAEDADAAESVRTRSMRL